MLEPYGCRVVAVNRTGREVPGCDEAFAFSDAGHVWAEADVFVLLMPLTRKTAIVVNAGRGELIVTADLVDALAEGRIAGAGLDITEPESLPAGHALWEITPHTANTISHVRASIGALAVHNAGLFATGEKMVTEVRAHPGLVIEVTGRLNQIHGYSVTRASERRGDVLQLVVGAVFHQHVNEQVVFERSRGILCQGIFELDVLNRL